MERPIVQFPDAENRYYDFASHELYSMEGEVLQLPYFSLYERNLLELFVENTGVTLSREQILNGVKSVEYEATERTVDVHVVNLRKAIGKSAIKSVRGIGYRYEGPQKKITEKVFASSTLPKVLTNTNVPYADEYSVIHRETEVAELINLMRGRKKALMLTGFGGIGKTSIARVLYGKLSEHYDSIGWIEYREDLKSSLLLCLALSNEIINPDLRWKLVYHQLKNDSSKKLLIIDNVDSDIQFNQHPTEDFLLQEISGWPNISLLLTSRLDMLPGYQSYPIRYLNAQDDKNLNCIDLFYYWFNQDEFKKPIHERVELESVKRLIDLAGFHTYTIEILAKSAKYEPSLADYVSQIEKVGFQFPSLRVSSSRHNFYAVAADQLRNLFQLQSRTETEKAILWDFSVLPNISLTPKECFDWLGYSGNDLDGLVREGWLSFNGGFSIHPLIRETMFLDLVDGKAPDGTTNQLILLLENGEFFCNGDSFTLAEKN